MPYIGGIEGGATNTIAVILDEKGEELGWAHGGNSNLWQVGLENAAKLMSHVIAEAKRKAGIPENQPLDSLGMCISGAGQKQHNASMLKLLYEEYPNVSKHFLLKSDTFGSIATVCAGGGVVLISGTGSNCQYVAADGRTSRCGGWGHAIGDEGSAFWIAHRAVKYVFRHDDNLDSAPENPDLVRQLMYKYFNSTDRYAMLDYFYTKFSKPFIAGFCKPLAEGATKNEDPLCKLVFQEAGRDLAKHVIALLPVIPPALKERKDGLQVVCVGSVWKSWELLKKAFMATLHSEAKGKLSAISLVLPTKPSAVGAALIASRACGIEMDMDLCNNAKTLHQAIL